MCSKFTDYHLQKFTENSFMVKPITFEKLWDRIRAGALRQQPLFHIRPTNPKNRRINNPA